MKICTYIADFHGFSQFNAGQSIKDNQILLQLWASAKTVAYIQTKKYCQ